MNTVTLAYSWFQTSLPIAAMLQRRLIITCRFRVTAFSGHAALALSPSPSGIAFKLNRVNCLWSAALGKVARLLINLAWPSLPLCLPSATSCAGTFVQISKRQFGELQASLKAA